VNETRRTPAFAFNCVILQTDSHKPSSSGDADGNDHGRFSTSESAFHLNLYEDRALAELKVWRVLLQALIVVMLGRELVEENGESDAKIVR
jgi:hypothetical protein